MRTKRKQLDQKTLPARADTVARINSRRRRRVVKALTGAIVGGIIAGPVGVAAGAMVGASVRRGPVRRKGKAQMPTKPMAKSKVQKPGRATPPRNATRNPR